MSKKVEIKSVTQENKMEFKFDATNNDYIKINVSGLLVKSEIISVISQLLQHPEYLDKHSYWDLRKATMGLSIADLSEIIGILHLYKPRQKQFANKSALLISGQMNTAMANVFVTMTKMLSFNYRVFKDKEHVLSYLCS